MTTRTTCFCKTVAVVKNAAVAVVSKASQAWFPSKLAPKTWRLLSRNITDETVGMGEFSNAVILTMLITGCTIKVEAITFIVLWHCLMLQMSWVVGSTDDYFDINAKSRMVLNVQKQVCTAKVVTCISLSSPQDKQLNFKHLNSLIVFKCYKLLPLLF